MAKKPHNDRLSTIVVTAIVALVTLVVGGVGGYFLSKIGDPVAVVNGQKITKQQLYDYMYGQSGKNSLDQLIQKILVLQEGKQLGITVSEDEIGAEMQKIISQVGSEDQLNQILEQYGMSRTDLENEIEADLISRKAVADRVTVTEDDIQKYYDDNKDTVSHPEQVHARHILVDTEEKANEIMTELKNGGDFVQLAADNSTDDSNAQSGGDLGYFARGKMVPEFDDVVFDMNVGDLAIAHTTYGYHVIELLDKKAAVTDLASLHDEIKATLVDQETNTQIGNWIDELRGKATITYVTGQ